MFFKSFCSYFGPPAKKCSPYGLTRTSNRDRDRDRDGEPPFAMAWRAIAAKSFVATSFLRGSALSRDAATFALMCECSNIRIFERPSVRISRCPNARVFECSKKGEWKLSDMAVSFLLEHHRQKRSEKIKKYTKQLKNNIENTI